MLLYDLFVCLFVICLSLTQFLVPNTVILQKLVVVVPAETLTLNNVDTKILFHSDKILIGFIYDIEHLPESYHVLVKNYRKGLN